MEEINEAVTYTNGWSQVYGLKAKERHKRTVANTGRAYVEEIFSKVDHLHHSRSVKSATATSASFGIQ